MKLYEIKGEMQKLGDFEFYEHDENIPMPLSFKHIAIQDDGTYIYGTIRETDISTGNNLFCSPRWPARLHLAVIFLFISLRH